MAVWSSDHFYQLFWTNKHATITLCSVFWSFGLCVAFLGPTLLDLGCKTQSVFADMSWVFFSQSLFILLGSGCGGFLLSRALRRPPTPFSCLSFQDKLCTPNILLLIGTTMMTITMATIPLCHQLWTLACVLAVMGFFMGTIDTVANVSMLRIYGKDVSPFLQALHFFYGVGAFVSPMIAQPFLLNEDCSPFIDKSSKPVHDLENDSLPATTLEEAQEMTHINYAFWIMSIIMIPVVILTFSLVGKDIYHKYQGDPGNYNPESGSPVNDDSRTIEITPNIPTTMNQIILISSLCASIMFLYDGLQAAYAGYIYSYAVKGPVRVPKSDAAYLNALFWGMFATGRLISIALATKLAPIIMLLANVLGCSFGMVLLLCFPSNQSVLIIGTIIMGMFMSSVFPTALSLTEQYIFVTPTITSFLVFGAALGEMTMPVIIGQQFDKSPLSFLINGMILCILSVAVFIAFWLAGLSMDSERKGVIGALSGIIPPTAPKQETEDTGLMTQHVKYYSRMKSDLSESDLSPEAKQ